MTDSISQPLAIPGNVMSAFYWSESVFRNIFKEDIDKIVLGGGTVLAMHWNHRVSTDLDYFLIEPNVLKAKELISKAREPLLELQAQGKLQGLEEAAYHLKFLIHDTETTVFTTQRIITDPPTHHEKQSGLKLENIDEVLAKKINGRILSLGAFTTRDFYDLCVACHKDPETFNRALSTASDSDVEAILHELKQWRSSDMIKEAITGKQLIQPRYRNLVDNLWSHAESALRSRSLPDHLFDTSNDMSGLER